jgi:hypothetical protein
MPTKDRELEAIGSIIALLTPLDQTKRSRVLEYVLKRLQMATLQAPAVGPREIADSSTPTAAKRGITDIRTLTAEKQPRSANSRLDQRSRRQHGTRSPPTQDVH